MAVNMQLWKVQKESFWGTSHFATYVTSWIKTPTFIKVIFRPLDHNVYTYGRIAKNLYNCGWDIFTVELLFSFPHISFCKFNCAVYNPLSGAPDVITNSCTAICKKNLRVFLSKITKILIFFEKLAKYVILELGFINKN